MTASRRPTRPAPSVVSGFKHGERVRVVRCGECEESCDHVGLIGTVTTRGRFAVDVCGPSAGWDVRRIYFKPEELEHLD